jgi:hypothetical protein
MYTILSIDDPRLTELTYITGDKFLFKPQNIDEYDFTALPELYNTQIIVEIVGFMLFVEGDLGYTLKIISPKKQEWTWGLRFSELNKDFKYLKKGSEDMRFLLLNIE